MCGLCGVFSGTDWTDGAAGDSASAVSHQRRGERRQRIALANRVLDAAGLALSDWQGAALLLRSRTGSSVVIPALPALWPAADRLSGRLVDPLDPDVLDALERA